MSRGKNVTDFERQAIIALLRVTTKTDAEVAAEVGRSVWTICHIRLAAGIPCHGRRHNVRNAEGKFARSRPMPPPTDIREHWLSVDRTLRSA